mmetsp:Transcript_16884/g.41861  ORF Transcript_16884/g.41861 Transcript_16884/m.41861 type:complete len:210 (-) Transcript_16884:888-1517(-)
MLPVTRKSCVGWKSSPHVACVWSVKVCRQLSVPMSHSFTVASPDVVPIRFPRLWKLMPLTQSRCPSPDITSSPPGKLHSFHVWSSEPVARTGSLWWKAREDMGPAWHLGKAFSAFTSAGFTGSNAGTSPNSSSSGHGVPRFFPFVAGGASAGLGLASFCSTWRCRTSSCSWSVSIFPAILSRSSRINIFSFMITSYLCRSSASVGSYCS